MKVSVIGLGKLGLPFAAVVNRWHDVLGVDANEKRINDIIFNVTLDEPRLNDYLKDYRLSVTTKLEDVKDSKIIFIFINTEHSDEYHTYPVLKLLEALRPYTKNKVIALISTIEPGSYVKEIVPLLNTMNYGGFAYNPVMVAIGNAVNYYEHPPYVIIGSDVSGTSELMTEFYKPMVSENDMIHGTIETVEIAKYALNLALISRISFMNMLAEYCEHYNGDIDFIKEMFSHDQRVTGSQMMNAGLGFGGPCFPLDARAFKKTLKKSGLPTDFLDSVISINHRQFDRVISIAKSIDRDKVAVMGVTYKPGVPYIIESQSYYIAEELAKTKDVMICDPMGIDTAKSMLGDKVQYTKDPRIALKFADIIIIATPWLVFKSINFEHTRWDQTIIDPWRLLRNNWVRANYIAFGLSDRFKVGVVLEDERKILRDLRRMKGDLFIDVGSFVGEYAINLSDNFKEVWAIEPASDSRGILESNIKKLGIKNIKVMGIGVSKFKGSSMLYRHESVKGMTGFSKMPEREDSLALFPIKLGKVSLDTLNNLVGNRQVDLIKVDTEGHESYVIEGANKIFPQVKAWLFEVHSVGDHSIVRNAMSKAGYNYVKDYNNRLYFERR